MKLDQNQAGKPSRVLHFRGVPPDATEGEIVQLGLPFGRMTNLVLAKKKNQVCGSLCTLNKKKTFYYAGLFGSHYDTEHFSQNSYSTLGILHVGVLFTFGGVLDKAEKSKILLA